MSKYVCLQNEPTKILHIETKNSKHYETAKRSLL